MTQLSVNLNKIALIRNARGRDFPNLVDMGEKAILAGASGLTIHPRPDQRHARYDDIASLKELCIKHSVELNIEGYPSREFLDYCLTHKVDQVTLVPDAPDQITSDHGWVVSQHTEQLKSVLTELRNAGIRSSLFMDTDSAEILLAKSVGADRIELHTESYARSFEIDKHHDHIDIFVDAYETATDAGLGVNAGHDLDLDNLGFFLQKVPAAEVSIGHALTVESLLEGWKHTIDRYIKICEHAGSM